MRMEDEVRIKIGKKTVKILRGKEAEVALKAMQYILDTVKSHKKIKIDIIDEDIPKDFNYGQAVLEALESGLENPIEIADFVLKKLEKVKKTS